MRSKLSGSITIMGAGAMVLGLLGVWLLPHRPAQGQETPPVPIPELRRWEENMKKFGVKHGVEKEYS